MSRRVQTVGNGIRLAREARYVSGGPTWVGFAPEDLARARSVYGRRASNYGPFLRVRIPSFAMDVRPVTRGEFLRFAWDLDKLSLAPARRLSLDFWKWFDRSVVYEDNLPVVGVSYDEAATFAWLHGGRLPWMYEWELAARGHNGRVLGAQLEQVSTIYSNDVTPFEESVVELMEFIARRDPIDPWESPFAIERLVGWVDEWVEGANFDLANTLASGPSGFPDLHWEHELVISRSIKKVSAKEKWPHPGLRGSSAREIWLGREISRSPTTGFRCAYNLD